MGSFAKIFSLKKSKVKVKPLEADGFVFKAPYGAPLLHMAYSCKSDTYHQIFTPFPGEDQSKHDGLGSLMFDSDNLCWVKDLKGNKTYITGGHDGTLKGYMQWIFDAQDGQKFKNITIRTDMEFEDGCKLKWTIHAGKNLSFVFDCGKDEEKEISKVLTETNCVTVCAEFGEGMKIFKEDLKKPKEEPFSFEIKLSVIKD